MNSVRILLVDDYAPWHAFVVATFSKETKLVVIGQVFDGLEAVQQAERLQPDVILLDVGLPTLNGIEAARRIREVSPASKILFVSENRSAAIAKEALSTGAAGYVVKSDAASELLAAIRAVLEGRRFVSSSLADHGLNGPPNQYAADDRIRDNFVKFTQPQSVGIGRHHEAGFYSDDGSFLDGFTRFIGTSLMGGKSVIVLAAESHREALLLTLQAHGLDVGAAIGEGRYISLDAADTLSKFMVNGSPDEVRFRKSAGDLILGAAKSVNGEPSRVAACGECAPLLWAQGNLEAAIRLERFWDEIAITSKIHVFCGYSLSSFQGGVGSYAFEKICSAHSAVHSR